MILSTHEGSIEYELRRPEVSKGLALLLHPHPLYEGTMYNKVITTALQTCVKNDLSALRFNYPGVGNSSGSFGYGYYESQQARVLLEKLGHQNIDWVIGFSFGCWVTYQLLSYLSPLKGIIWIAPSIHEGVMQSINWPSKRYIIQGTDDQLCPFPQNRLFSQKNNFEFLSIDQAGHFFHGKQIELKHAIQRCLND
jgi:alpha/beta superfamily hydrolase